MARISPIKLSASFPHRKGNDALSYFFKVCLIVVLLCCAAEISAQIPQKAPRHKVITIKEAEKWCDTQTIKNPEGIYWYPKYQAVVLVRNVGRGYAKLGPYEIVFIQCDNLLYPPGQVIGYISTTGDPTQLSLTLYKKVEVSGLSKPQQFIAKYNASQCAITYQRPYTKFSFNPFSLIPKIGRFIRFSHTDPNIHATEGLQRIYPKVLTSPLNSFQLPIYL